MKLASYIADGKPSFGVVVGGGVVTLNDKLGGKYADLKALVAANAFDEAAKAASVPISWPASTDLM